MGKEYTEINAEFVKLLAARGVTPAMIIELEGVGYAHGIQVFSGKRSGPQTRSRLARHLTRAELQVLGWFEPNVSSFAEIADEQEDAGIRMAALALEQHQKVRKAVRRISVLVQEHPEFFGELNPGDNCMDVAAAKLEAMLKPKQEEQAA